MIVSLNIFVVFIVQLQCIGDTFVTPLSTSAPYQSAL